MSLPLRGLNEIDCAVVLGNVGFFLGGKTERLFEGSSRMRGRDCSELWSSALTMGDITSSGFPKKTKKILIRDEKGESSTNIQLGTMPPGGAVHGSALP